MLEVDPKPKLIPDASLPESGREPQTSASGSARRRLCRLELSPLSGSRLPRGRSDLATDERAASGRWWGTRAAATSLRDGCTVVARQGHLPGNVRSAEACCVHPLPAPFAWGMGPRCHGRLAGIASRIPSSSLHRRSGGFHEHTGRHDGRYTAAALNASATASLCVPERVATRRDPRGAGFRGLCCPRAKPGSWASRERVR